MLLQDVEIDDRDFMCAVSVPFIEEVSLAPSIFHDILPQKLYGWRNSSLQDGNDSDQSLKDTFYPSESLAFLFRPVLYVVVKRTHRTDDKR